MRSSILYSSIRLLLALFALLGAGRAEAQLLPSSDVLLPYFEVDMDARGATTTFTLGNALNRTVDVRVDVQTNWGITVLTVPLTLQPNAILAVDLRDWIFGGKLPSRTLSQAEGTDLQAVLCGERSPKDKLYYSTELTPHRAVGYITFRTQGQRPDALWGDFFINDPGQSSQGDTLVNIDSTTGCPGLCERHLLRFVTDAKDVDADTRVVIWTGRTGQPSATPTPATQSASTTADTLVFNDRGQAIDTRQLPVLPVQRVTVGELGLKANAGWLDLQMDVPSFIGVFYGSDERHSVALQAYCAPVVFKVGPGIRLEKRTNGQVAELPPGPSIPIGTAVAWEYEVENIGDVALADVEVTDDQGVVVKCPQDELAPGESMVCTGKGTATACQYTNTGKVTARPTTGPAVSAEDVSHYFGVHNAVLDVQTLVNGDDANTPTGPMLDPGAPVSFTYVVRNTGAVRVSEIQVTDDQGIAVTCPKTMLRPGESMTCTAGGKAAAGQHTNVGAVAGNPPCGPAVKDSDPGNYYGKTDTENPKVDIEKHTNGQDADTGTGPEITVGAPVLWEYFVTNSGNVRLTNVKVTDDKGVAVSCPQTALDPGASMRCTGNGTAVEGQYANLGTVTGTSPQGKTVTDTDPSHYIGRRTTPPEAPCIDIEKHTNGQDADTGTGPEITVGAPVLWEYFVTNSGNVRLTNVKVTDDKGVAVSCPQTALDPGASMRCTGNGTAVEGQYANLGTVTGTSPQGKTVTDTDPSHYLGRRATPPEAPCIDIEKHTNGQDADTGTGPEITVGAPVLWEYFVTNSGNVRLTNVKVTDDKGVAVSCPQTALDPGASMRCTGNGTAVEGQYANLGTVTGTSPQGKTVTDSDPSHYLGRRTTPPEAPCIKIEKHTNGQDADTGTGPEITVGAPVLWEYFVTNSGNVRLTSVKVTDSKGVVVSCPQTALDPGASMRCTGNGTATEGQYYNLGTVTGTSPQGKTVTDSDPSHYIGRRQADCNQGCSPGYWKNHTSSWGPTGYSTSQKVQSVFQNASAYPSLGGSTLLQALYFSGGSSLEGAASNLLRAAVAGLLNAAHNKVSYPRSTAQLIQDVNAALAGNNRDTMLSLASAIDHDNNLSCPLN